jgi:hypothetical protein
MSKYSKEIQDKTREWVGTTFISITHPDLNNRMAYIRRSFIRSGEDMTLLGLIKTSHSHSSFLPPTVYSHYLDEAYVDCGYKQIMSYEQFIFAFPQIWYTTLFRLIKEWESQYTGTELAY